AASPTLLADYISHHPPRQRLFPPAPGEDSFRRARWRRAAAAPRRGSCSRRGCCSSCARRCGSSTGTSTPSELCRINEDQKVALDLDPYVKKLLNARRRVVLVNNILQNAQVSTCPPTGRGGDWGQSGLGVPIPPILMAAAPPGTGTAAEAEPQRGQGDSAEESHAGGGRGLPPGATGQVRGCRQRRELGWAMRSPKGQRWEGARRGAGTPWLWHGRERGVLPNEDQGRPQVGFPELEVLE
uniref:Biogenesis of lysosome-related organelles complex 1 subunit 7 n=1 Tax=Strigops habroptila TaxID=2489341 RepID=A0A672V0S3_STRHB